MKGKVRHGSKITYEDSADLADTWKHLIVCIGLKDLTLSSIELGCEDSSELAVLLSLADGVLDSFFHTLGGHIRVKACL